MTGRPRKQRQPKIDEDFRMRTKQQLRGTDIAILTSVPAAVVLFVFSALLIHGEYGPFAAMLGLIVVAWLIVLPLWVVLHIAFDRGRSPVQVLWIESGLAGACLVFALVSLLEDWLGDRGALLIAGLAGGAVALTPYTMRLLRSPSGRRPAR